MSKGVTSLRPSLMQVVDDTLLPRRYWVLAVFAVTFGALWLTLNHGIGGDWRLFVLSAKSFTTAPMDGDVVAPIMVVIAYPFTFVGLLTGWLVLSTLCMLLGLLTIRCIERTAELVGFGERRDRERAVLFGGLFFLYGWALPGAAFGHADDVIALTCLAVACRALAGGRWLAVSVAIAVAIDVKPWVALVLPLVAACSGMRVRGLVVTGVVAVLPWLPFLVAQHGHLGSLSLPVAPDSGLRYLGVQFGSYPSWPRMAQVAVALPLGAYAVFRGKWYLVPAIAFAARINLDPQTYPYYMAGAIFGLFLWDVVRPLRLAGIRTALGCVVLALLPVELKDYGVYTGGAMDVVVLLRLAVVLVTIGALFAPGSRSQAGTGKPDVSSRDSLAI